MLLRRLTSAAAFVLIVGAVPSAAEAKVSVGDVLSFPFRWLGGALFGGTVDKLKSGLDATVASVDTRLAVHEVRVAGLASGLLSDAKGKVDDTLTKVDHSLEARILQIKTSADDGVDRALSQVNGDLRDRLIQVDAIGKGLVRDAGRELRKSIDDLDGRLRARTADIDRMANELVANADQALRDRIAQVDEAAGRRLGDVDVIASKQRIGLEESAIRVAVIVGAVVFVVYVLRKLWKAYLDFEKDLIGVRGARRTAAIARKLGPELAEPLAAALAGAAVLFVLYRWLPMGASREAAQLVEVHVQALEASVATVDYPRARFHASHLEYLKPDEAAHFSALADKAALLRDIAARPTLFATRSAIGDFEQRVRAVERALGSRPDPDVLVMHAIARWEGGASRADEYVAASLAARALRMAPRGFALAPLARVYVQTFLDAPFFADDAGLGRDAASIDDLREVVAGPAPEVGGSPFTPAVELAALTRELERSSTEHYVRMVKANAEIVASTRNKRADAPRLAALRNERATRAQAVVNAWTKFDAALRDAIDLNGPIVLGIFRLNDAILTRARWFLEQPATAEEGMRIDQLDDGAASVALKLKLVPARIAWARRYRALLTGPARPFVEFEEAERFHAWERWTLEFEQAMTALEVAGQTGAGDDRARWRVVVAASALALYVEAGDRRRPLAQQIAGSLLAPPDAAAAQAKTPDAPATLEQALLVRGPLLI